MIKQKNVHTLLKSEFVFYKHLKIFSAKSMLLKQAFFCAITDLFSKNATVISITEFIISVR
jgi:hypothetical protein